MRIVEVPIIGSAYAIHIGRRLGELFTARIFELPDVKQLVVITDDHVAKLHLERLPPFKPLRTCVLRVPPGESSKTLATVSGLYDKLADARIERRDLILTFGGGVIGDLGGFVAATWLRGIRFVQVPTTLEAAVDASVGGKTGVNHPAGKNLIGAFHQPSAVIIATELLETLPQRDFAAGLAESVKHAAIRDPAFLDWHEQNSAAIKRRDPNTIIELIARNCAIKADVVARDEHEQGLRAILNYGHTIGHAVEHLLDYELRHGECVALGIIAENELARVRGLLDRSVADRIRSLLARFGLPTRLPRPLPAERVIEVTRLDKKVTAGAVNFVLLPELGQPERVADVSDAEIAAALEAIQPK